MLRFERKSFTPFKAWKKLFGKKISLERVLMGKRVKCVDYRVLGHFIIGKVTGTWNCYFSSIGYASIEVQREDNGETICKDVKTIWEILE